MKVLLLLLATGIAVTFAYNDEDHSIIHFKADQAIDRLIRRRPLSADPGFAKILRDSPTRIPVPPPSSSCFSLVCKCTLQFTKDLRRRKALALARLKEQLSKLWGSRLGLEISVISDRIKSEMRGYFRRNRDFAIRFAALMRQFQEVQQQVLSLYQRTYSDWRGCQCGLKRGLCSSENNKQTYPPRV